MLKVRLESTTEYDRIIQFAMEQGLEYDPEEQQDFSDIVGAWKIVQPGDYIIGTAMLDMKMVITFFMPLQWIRFCVNLDWAVYW